MPTLIPHQILLLDIDLHVIKYLHVLTVRVGLFHLSWSPKPSQTSWGQRESSTQSGGLEAAWDHSGRWGCVCQRDQSPHRRGEPLTAQGGGKWMKGRH